MSQANVLKELAAVWKKHPDYRLAQLIYNVFPNGSGNDPYFLPDAEFIRQIKTFYDPKQNPAERMEKTDEGA